MVKRKLNIAIIDDEQHAIETMVYDLREAFQQQIEILFTANNPFEGARQVKLFKPDILFLDIVMPGLSGFDLLKLIDDLDTKVVFTTAFLELQQQIKNSGVFASLLKPLLLTDLERIFDQVLICNQNSFFYELIEKFNDENITDFSFTCYADYCPGTKIQW